MALGATIKVGVDDSKVRRGLRGIRAMFGRLGGTVGRMAAGAARAGKMAAVTLTGLAIAAGLSFKHVAELGSELSDLSLQTGVSVTKLMQLQEAMRLAGVPAAQAGQMISRFRMSLADAVEEAGPARDAFMKLGLMPGKLIQEPVDRAFETLLRRIQDLPENFVGLESAMSDIFGARVGFTLLRLAKAYDQEMARALKNVGPMAEQIEGMTADLDMAADNLGRIKLLYQEIVLRILKQLPLDRIVSFMENLDTAKIAEGIGDFMADPGGKLKAAMESVGEQIKAWATAAGEAFVSMIKAAASDIGQGIGEGIKSAFPSLGGGPVSKAAAALGLGPKLGAPAADPAKVLGKKIDRTNQLLTRLEMAPARYG